jgi:hypothetical protein
MRAVCLLAVVSVVSFGCAAVAEDATNFGAKKDSGHGEIGPAADETGAADGGGDSAISDDTSEPTDTGEDIDGTTPDTGTVDIDTGTPDTGAPDTGTADTGMVTDTGTVTGGTFIFPKKSDPRVLNAGGDHFWMAGDYYSGTRSTTLASATSFSTGMAIDNVLTCDSVQLQVRINGTLIGTKTISSGPVSIPMSFTFAAITGPTYTIEYRCPIEVTGGCGSIKINDDVSSVTLK